MAAAPPNVLFLGFHSRPLARSFFGRSSFARSSFARCGRPSRVRALDASQHPGAYASAGTHHFRVHSVSPGVRISAGTSATKKDRTAEIAKNSREEREEKQARELTQRAGRNRVILVVRGQTTQTRRKSFPSSEDRLPRLLIRRPWARFCSGQAKGNDIKRKRNHKPARTKVPAVDQE